MCIILFLFDYKEIEEVENEIKKIDNEIDSLKQKRQIKILGVKSLRLELVS